MQVHDQVNAEENQRIVIGFIDKIKRRVLSKHLAVTS